MIRRASKKTAAVLPLFRCAAAAGSRIWAKQKTNRYFPLPAADVPSAAPAQTGWSFIPTQVPAVTYRNPAYLKRQERIDRLITGRFTGSLIMVALLLGIFWLTITGANYPSSFLWDQLFRLETWLAAALTGIGAPEWVVSSLIYGVFRVVAWVVSVMLPPMAIFFPLFTLLEDL